MPPQIGVTYDWRLSVANMERRDSYFSHLRADVELMHRLNKEKVGFKTVIPRKDW